MLIPAAVSPRQQLAALASESPAHRPARPLHPDPIRAVRLAVAWQLCSVTAQNEILG